MNKAVARRRLDRLAKRLADGDELALEDAASTETVLDAVELPLTSSTSRSVSARRPRRQVLACVYRMFGGLRTGDLHALRWNEHVDTDSFAVGIAPR